jgi:pimeloyl-ACP methyl ester carboxylesterase
VFFSPEDDGMGAGRIRSGFVTGESGLKLYWRSAGSGPAIVCCNGLGVSTFFWKFVVAHFQDRFRVVVWDYVGHGQSDRPDHVSQVATDMPSFARDLGRIQNELALGPAVLLGHSMGCQVILEYALQHPERVAGVVPILGTAGRVLDTFNDTPLSYYGFKVIRRLARYGGDTFTAVFKALVDNPVAWKVTLLTGQLDRHYASREDFGPYLAHLAAFDPHLFLALVWDAHCHDLFPRLPDLTVPALVIAGECDNFTPLWTSRRMATSIPGAELMILAKGSHAALIEQPEDINHRLSRFLDARANFTH